MKRLLPSILLAPLVACGSGAHPSPGVTSRTIHVELGNQPDSGSVMSFDGVRVEVRGDVLFEVPTGRGMTIHMRSPEGEDVVRSYDGEGHRVDGRSVDVLDGVLRWGDDEYGPLTTDDVVALSATGVTINGEPAQPR